MTPIAPIAPLPPILAEAMKAADTGGFRSMLESALQAVEGSRQEADRGVEAFVKGEDDEVHRTVLAVQKAELTFELFVQVRNKVVQAYQEVMRMQM